MNPDGTTEVTGRASSLGPAPRGPRTRVGAPAPGRALLALTFVLAALGIALRLIPRSGLWLDEALSVNISGLPLTDIPDALRHDGHPPLYYWLLHLWGLVGSSDWWMRAFSALVAILGLPLAYLAGRRLGHRKGAGGLGGHRVGLITVCVWAVLPFAVRYGSETRMYALVSTLVLAGYLLVDNLLGEPGRGDQPLPRPAGSAIGLALVTGALLLTHYWALWLGAAVAILTVVVLIRSVSPDRSRRAWVCLASLGAGLVLFSPWVPTMLYQSEHTGTPWGEVFRPATIVVVTITDLVGGGFGELQIMSFVLFAVIAVAVFGALRSRAGREVVELGATPQTRILAELGVLVGTLLIGWAASFASSSTYASRYAAVVAPLFALCVAAGLAMLRSTRATTAVTAIVCAVLVVGSAVEITTDRTQAGTIADGIAADLGEQDVPPEGPGDGRVVVLVCPDQLGPATHRALQDRGVDATVLAFPDPDADPRLVDWVDYEERNTAADPTAFAERVLATVPGDASIYVVSNTGYLTFEGKCEAMVAALATSGAAVEQLDAADPDAYFESMGLWVRRPAS